MNIIKKIFNIEEKKDAAIKMEPISNGNLLFPFVGQGRDHEILTMSEAVNYMMSCAPVWTALHKIAKGVSSITPLLKNKKTGEFIYDHPLLDLLANPDADVTYNELIEAMTHWYIGTGNVFIRALGLTDKAPTELRIMPSHSTTVTTGQDGYASIITTNLLGISNTYKRVETTVDNRTRYRFYANKFNEIYQIRTFNPMSGSNMTLGMSSLNAVFYEMRCYIESCKTNLSTMRRSSRLSGIIKTEHTLSPDQKSKIEASLQRVFAGSENAGRNILLEQNMDFVDLMKTSRDMDYEKTLAHSAETIYKALDIPLPLVNATNMTYDNYESSQYYLFKDAVLPTLNRLMQELTLFLMPRFSDSDDLILSYNISDIPQLEPERNAQLKTRKESGIFTINELRVENGCENLAGGQYIYGGVNETPLAEDLTDKSQKIISDASDDEDNMNDKENADHVDRATFIDRLKKQINKDGSARFTDDEIEEIANEHYGNEQS